MPSFSRRHVLTTGAGAARAEGGKLVVYAGGDTPSQQDGTKATFKVRFPEIDLTLIVDHSKYHDARVDNQLATDTLVPDVVQFQTMQDFDCWKQQGRLLRYKPPASPRSTTRSKLRRERGWPPGRPPSASCTTPPRSGRGSRLTPLDLVDP